MPLQDPANAQVIYARAYGPLLIAILISTFMYGVSLSFVLQYFKLEAKRDTSVLKVTILLLITLTTLETIFTGHQLYDTFITNTGNPALEDRIPLQYLTAFVAQLFFASRIWSVSKSLHSRVRLMAVPVILLGLLQMGAGLGTILTTLVAGRAISKTFSSLGSRRHVLMDLETLQGVATAACDILINISLCYVLHSHRSGIKRTNSLINRMIIYAINRGIVTSICALLGASLYYLVPNSYYYQIPPLANPYLYVISVVSILTSREGLREKIDQSFHLSDLYTNTSRSDATNGRQNVRSDLTEDKNHQTV
ncbi:hypothetical protein M422DRAFT_30164 [Sphaerobolus stellatus SS14]|uniref:DUF6534 domain-containing protein n=1 Tax=Sphaerobolus stellatus (strain SS14) TaxID=990650 RepID=A0A0C9VD79_SPHS4|nr:hypothetical protein M422DRAFT_30164 [Sphaerobolus stellatus SS14]